MARVRSDRSAGGQSKNNLLQIVPIVLAILVFFFFIKFLFGGQSPTTADDRWGNYVFVTPSASGSKVYVYMSGDSKKAIDAQTKYYSTDSKLTVEDGEALIATSAGSGKVYVDKWGEIKFAGINGSIASFELNNASVWVESTATTNFKLKQFDAEISGGSVVSFNQNAIASNVYVLKWDAQIKTKNETVRVAVGQKLTFLQTDLSGGARLADKIESIDDYFRTTALFMRHNGEAYMTSSTTLTGSTGTGELASTGTLGTGSTYMGKNRIVIVSPQDESTVEGESVDIEWRVNDPSIVKVTLNNRDTVVDPALKKFVHKAFPLKESLTDIVYRAYNADGVIIAKGTFTVYTTKKSVNTAQEKPTSVSYPLKNSDFRIIAPTDNPYRTTESVVQIKWQVNKWVVKYITINGFRLTKYSSYAPTWYYFANKDFGTMSDGMNLYTIRYYGKEDNLLYEHVFTLVKDISPADALKEEKKTSSTPTPTSTTPTNTAKVITPTVVAPTDTSSPASSDLPTLPSDTDASSGDRS